MAPDDVKILQVGMQALSEGLQRIEKAVEKNREETREDIKRIHERLDDQKSVIVRSDCERYRRECPACQDVKDFVTKEQHDKDIKSVKGYPAWVVVLFSVCAALITFVVTKGVH